MQNLNLRNSKELTRLAEMLNKKVSETEKELLDYLEDFELIEDDLEFAGQTIGKILIEQDSFPSAIAYMALNTRNEEAISLMKELVVVWCGGECPECGYHMETETDGAHSQEWEDARCLNSNCGHRATTEPLSNFAFEDE